MIDFSKYLSLKSDLLFYRVVLLAGVVAYPLFGFVYMSYISVGDPLPFVYRIFSSLFFLVLLISTFVSDFVKSRIVDFIYLAAGYAFLQLSFLAYVHNYSLNVALSILIVIMIVNFIFDGDYKLKYFNLFMLVSVFTSLFLGSSVVDRFFYSLAVVFVVFISCYISVSRYRSRKEFEWLFRSSPAGLVRCDDDGTIEEVNEKMLEISGADSESELVGLNVFDLIDIDWGSEPDLSFEDRNLPKVKQVSFPSGKEPWIGFMFEPYVDELGKGSGFVVAFQDITSRKKAQEMEEFLHDLLRHDVKNKIQVATGYHELIKEYDLSNEVKELLNKSNKALKDSEKLIEKVRTLVKVEEQEKIKKININEIIEETMPQLRDQAEQKNIQIKYEEINCEVLGGPLLKELFSNLIENSIIHSNCSKIKITGKKKNEKCLVTIEDNGKGISDGRKSEIFKKGFKNEQTGGSGLGMFIVKEIIELYEGDIKVKDSDMGGTRFDIFLKIFN